MAKIGWIHRCSTDEYADRYFLSSEFDYHIAVNFNLDGKYKICKGYKDTKYFVTDKGTIYHYIPQYDIIKEVKPFNCRGYKRINVRTETGKTIQFFVHRIVASLFIPNPTNKEEVNHKNRDKQDNRVENLEWVTKSENELHKWHTQGGMKQSTKDKIGNANRGGKSYRAKKVECIETGETWETAKQASFSIGMSQNRVSQVCKTGKALKGKHFRYI